MKIEIFDYDDSEERKKDIIQIDPWDTWSLDYTLAKIILPCLKQLKETTHGAPFVDYEDVPENLRVNDKKEEWDTDSQHFERWNWVFDEMIWSFTAILDDDEYLHWSDEEYQNRIKNGFRLFGKYYGSLWDQNYTLVAQSAEAIVSNTIKCRSESDQEYQNKKRKWSGTNRVS